MSTDVSAFSANLSLSIFLFKCSLCPPLQTPCAQYLKANVEYLRQNYRKALKVLGSAPKNPIAPDTGECLSSYFFNNLGCIHCTLGKYSLAAHYFRKALEENDAALNGFPPLDKGMRSWWVFVMCRGRCVKYEMSISLPPSLSPHLSQPLPSLGGLWWY